MKYKSLYFYCFLNFAITCDASSENSNSKIKSILKRQTQSCSPESIEARQSDSEIAEDKSAQKAVIKATNSILMYLKDGRKHPELEHVFTKKQTEKEIE